MKNKTDSKSTVVVRAVMYVCVVAVILMDLWPQQRWGMNSGPSYGVYFLLSVMVIVTELILRNEKRNPGIW